MPSSSALLLGALLAPSAAEGLIAIERRCPLGYGRARSPLVAAAPPSCGSLGMPLHQQALHGSAAPRVPSAMLSAAADTAEAPSRGGIATAWGVLGFLSILASAIRRLLPHALQPLSQKDLSVLQVAMYAASVLTFAYVEGYGAFQKKFSPMVVRRALTLGRAGTPLHHKLLAPFYSMGLFHATKKRKTVSWSVSISVALLVGIVKRLPYPWRSIVDAGVCVGLLWGGASIAAFYTQALASGSHPQVSAELPEGK